MDAKLAHSIFEKARDRYESAGRIAFIAVIGLLIFHLTTFYPFIDATVRLERVKGKNDQLSQLNGKAAQLQSQLESLERSMRSRINTAIDRTLENKIADFQELNRGVTQIRTGNENEMQMSRRDPQVQTNFPQNQFVQQPMQAQSRISEAASGLMPPHSSLPDFDSTTVEKIRNSQSLDQLRSLLLPYVREHIIDVRFAELNDDLQQMTTPLEQEAAAIRDSSEQLARQFRDYAGHFKKLENGMQSFINALGKLKIEPPEDDQWWTTVQSKTATLDQLGAGAENSLEQFIDRKLSERIGSELDTALRRHEAIQASLDKEIDELEKQFKSQQEQMQGLGNFAKWGLLSLKPVAVKFPLLLAVILAAVSVVLSRRIHELALAITMMPDAGEGLRHWFLKRIGGLPDTFSIGEIPLRDILVTGAGLSWVAFTSWQVAQWQEVGASAVIMFVLAALILVFAGWYHRRTIRTVTALTKTEGMH